MRTVNRILSKLLIALWMFLLHRLGSAFNHRSGPLDCVTFRADPIPLEQRVLHPSPQED